MLPLLLCGVFVIASGVLIALRGDSPAGQPQAHSAPKEPDTSWSPSPQPTGKTVSLAIDFGNGARREFAALPWSQGMTVGDLMRRAAKFRPRIAYVQLGENESAYLTSLEGVASEAAGGRYWLYSVNDRPAKVGFAVQPLAAGDRVLWKFSGPE